MRITWAQRAVFGGLALAVVAAGPASAACPSDLCECLGSAADFSIVGTTLQMKSGKVNEAGDGYAVGSFVDGSVCSTTAQLSAKPDGESTISGDLVATATSGVAVKFKGFSAYGYVYPGTFIDGDLATGGGTIEGAEFGQVAGSTATTVGNPLVTACNQARSDIGSASARLAGLPVSQTIDKLTVAHGDTYNLDAGAGTFVVSIDDLVLKPLKYASGAAGSLLNVNLGESTDAVILNVKHKLAIGTACEITVTGGDIEDVIINVVGTGPTVKIKPDAAVAPALLAPSRKLQVAGNAIVANIFGGGLKIRGAQIEEPWLCF